ncbi:hypothetical protein Cgig2_029909 [Carnegiea gigantea]|uniref:DUF4283 domain-containing protein n=1 Tax=Carnegiea gigantea TaxID=171969 RepID=A0A9Q1QJI2_9CARY|nr:hypothetical protein Cgig2_029909 [Carnegiea gigantea]
MLCLVIGVNPPLEVIEGFVRRIWQAFEIDKICLVRKGVFLVRFQNINDHFTMVQRGVYFFDNKPFLIKPWNEEMDINTETLVTLPVWGSESLSKLGSMLGVPIKTDKYTRDKAFLRYARLLIEIQLQKNFPDFIDFVNKHNVAVRQKVEYDWKPTKCTYCKMPIIRQDPPPPAPSQPTIDAEGFIQVRRKVVASVYKEQSAPTQLQNSFDNLTEGEDPKTMHPSTKGGGLPQWKGSVDWIGYRDDSTSYFFAKIKKRKTDTYILLIHDDQGHTRQGFVEVKELMQTYYQSLLGKQTLERTQLDPLVIGKGNTLTVEQ